MAGDAKITALKLQQLSRGCDYQQLAAPLHAACLTYDITTPRRVRHFIAQLCVETGGLMRFEESLSYSAERLVAVWPGRFPNLAAARPYASNPRALAAKVYNGRLGNSALGDGWLYRGRGPMMTTGKANYSEAQHVTGLPLLDKPEMLLDPAVGFDVAAHFWHARGCNRLVDADAGETLLADVAASIRQNEEDDLREARLKVNGGRIGLDEARAWLIKAGGIWRD